MLFIVRHNASSHPFCWRSYFVVCWSGPKPVYPGVHHAAGTLHPQPDNTSFPQESVLPQHKKKALLIGIRHDDDPTTIALAGPHRDVHSVKQLLTSEYHHMRQTSRLKPDAVDVYEYIETDIVVMLDGGKVDDFRLAPTRANIVSDTTTAHQKMRLSI
jgi:hypothetical protein